MFIYLSSDFNKGSYLEISLQQSRPKVSGKQ